MRSEKSNRLLSSKQLDKTHRQGSYSPKLSSSISQKSLWALSYKNQPVPDEIRRRLLFKSRQPEFDKQSDEEQDIMAVQQVDENDANEKQKSKLTRYKIISDWDQFSERRNRIKSEKQERRSSERCRSVQSLKLPQVIEDKKEDDQLNRLELSKLFQVKDQNQFNEKRNLRSCSSYTEAPSRVQSLQLTKMPSQLPQQIPQMQAEEGKEVEIVEKSLLDAELQKIIVDELDQKKKRKEEFGQEIQSIMQEKNQQEIDTQKLRRSLGKFNQECEYLKSHADEVPGSMTFQLEQQPQYTQILQRQCLPVTIIQQINDDHEQEKEN